jgi:hypothetical protein
MGAQMTATLLPVAADCTVGLRINIDGQARQIELIGWACDPASDKPPTPVTPIGSLHGVAYLMTTCGLTYYFQPGHAPILCRYDCDAQSMLLRGV